MTLYDPMRQPDVAPEDAILLVHRFIQRCDGWAETQEIPKRLERVRLTNDPKEAAALHAWVAYRSFLAHTLQELESGKLDRWFVGPQDVP